MAEKKKHQNQTDGSCGTVEELYKCEICGKEFGTKQNLQQHQVVHSSERPYECKECGKLFKTKPVLTQHTAIHTEERLYECKECGKMFKTKSVLTHHIAHHCRERSCPECNATFKRKQDLKRHRRLHSHEKRHPCESCGKSFKRKSALTEHLAVHSENRPFKCSECNKTFKLKHTLDRHKVVHSREKPYKCEKSFRRRGTLGSHVLAHRKTRESPYTCDQCGTVCKDTIALTVHTRSHAGVGSEAMITQTAASSATHPFSCQLCGLDYTEESSLRRHLMTHTKNTSLPQEEGRCEEPGSACESTNLCQNLLSEPTPTELTIPQISHTYGEGNSNVWTDYYAMHKKSGDIQGRQSVGGKPWTNSDTARQTSGTDRGFPVTSVQTVVRLDQLGECQFAALNNRTESIPHHQIYLEEVVAQGSSEVQHISQRVVEQGSAHHGWVSPQIPPEILAGVEEMKAAAEFARKTTQHQTHLMTNTKKNASLPQEYGQHEEPGAAHEPTNLFQNLLSAPTPTMLAIPQTSHTYEEGNFNLRNYRYTIHNTNGEMQGRHVVGGERWTNMNTARQTSETDRGYPVTSVQPAMRPVQLGECHFAALNSNTESIPHHQMYLQDVAQVPSEDQYISQGVVERGSAHHGRVSPQIPPEILAGVDEMTAAAEFSRRTTEH